MKHFDFEKGKRDFGTTTFRLGMTSYGDKYGHSTVNGYGPYKIMNHAIQENNFDLFMYTLQSLKNGPVENYISKAVRHNRNEMIAVLVTYPNQFKKLLEKHPEIVEEIAEKFGNYHAIVATDALLKKGLPAELTETILTDANPFIQKNQTGDGQNKYYQRVTQMQRMHNKGDSKSKHAKSSTKSKRRSKQSSTKKRKQEDRVSNNCAKRRAISLRGSS